MQATTSTPANGWLLVTLYRFNIFSSAIVPLSYD